MEVPGFREFVRFHRAVFYVVSSRVFLIVTMGVEVLCIRKRWLKDVWLLLTVQAWILPEFR